MHAPETISTSLAFFGFSLIILSHKVYGRNASRNAVFRVGVFQQDGCCLPSESTNRQPTIDALGFSTRNCPRRSKKARSSSVSGLRNMMNSLPDWVDP